MNTSRNQSLADLDGALAALMHLCRPFSPAGFIAECDVVNADTIPSPADALLVHDRHMTVELERHHGRPVQVNVLHDLHEQDTYTRMIGLTLKGTSTVVEWGIVRLDLRFLSSAIRQEILDKKKPLGAILIEHEVHRRIEPRYFVQFPEQSPVIRLFDAKYNSIPAYGRLGTIFCNNEPAIELLEIVVNTEVKNSP